MKCRHNSFRMSISRYDKVDKGCVNWVGDPQQRHSSYWNQTRINSTNALSVKKFIFDKTVISICLVFTTLFNYGHRRAYSDIISFGIYRLEVPTSLLTLTLHLNKKTFPISNQPQGLPGHLSRMELSSICFITLCFSHQCNIP